MKIGFRKTNDNMRLAFVVSRFFVHEIFISLCLNPTTHAQTWSLLSSYFIVRRAQCAVSNHAIYRYYVSLQRISLIPLHLISSPPLADVLFNYLGLLFFENAVNFVFQWDRKINCIGRAHCTLYLRHCFIPIDPYADSIDR